MAVDGLQSPKKKDLKLARTMRAPDGFSGGHNHSQPLLLVRSQFPDGLEPNQNCAWHDKDDDIAEDAPHVQPDTGN